MISKERRDELVVYLEKLWAKYWDENEATLKIRDFDIARDADMYASYLAAEFVEHGADELAALDLALDDLLDAVGDLEFTGDDVAEAILTVADEWERAARALAPGDPAAKQLLLAVRILRGVVPRLSLEDVEETLRARAHESEMLNYAAEMLEAREKGDTELNRFLREKGEEASTAVRTAIDVRFPVSQLIVYDHHDDTAED